MPIHDVHLHYFLRPDHWDVADLWVSNWSPSMPALGFNAHHDWLFEHLESLHESGFTTICAVNTHNGAIAGFVTVDAEAGRLAQIVVASSARGSGVAGKLLDEAKRVSPTGLTAKVDAGAARAMRFFTREGFIVEGAGENGSARLMWRA